MRPRISQTTKKLVSTSSEFTGNGEIARHNRRVNNSIQVGYSTRQEQKLKGFNNLFKS